MKEKLRGEIIFKIINYVEHNESTEIKENQKPPNQIKIK